MKNALLASVPLSLVAVACLSAPPELNEDQIAARDQYELTEAPSPQHELDIRYESRVRLIGYDASVESVTPGQAFDVTWYWQVDRRLPADFRLFTHVSDGNDADRCNADQTSDNNGCSIASPMRGHNEGEDWIPNFDPSFWTEGTWVRDPQHFTLPAEWHSDRVTFYVGVYSGEHRLSVTQGPADDERRGRALSLPIAGGPGHR